MRRRLLVLAMSFIMVFTMMPMMSGAVFAADETVVDSVNINYDTDKLLYNVAYTEGEFNRSMYNNVTVSQGLTFNQGNSSLMIRQGNGEFWGIGDGINSISTSKTYYYCYAVFPEDGYTWPESITSLTIGKKVTISTVPGITVKVNNTSIPYGFIEKGSTIVRIYIPMGSPSTDPVVKSVSINENYVSIVRGESTSLSATVTGTAAKTVTWSVSDKTSSATTIDNDGNLVIGEDEALGSVTVTATSTADPSKSASISVTVIEAPLTIDSVTVLPNTESLYTGTSKKFGATVEGSEIDKTVTWAVEGGSSEDTTIDDTGELAIGEDETAETLTVKATSVKDGTKVGTATVTVLQRTMISNVNISYDTSKVLFDETSTEGEYNRSMYNNVTVSQGLIFNQGNSSLMIRQGNGELWGIGDGTDLIDVSKTYYYCYALNTEDAYKWPGSVTSLQNGKKVDISTVSGLTVKVNNTSITNGFIQMTSYFIWVYIPMESLIHTCEKEDMVQRLPATVSAGGNKAYYVCSCGNWYWDEGCTQLISDHDEVVIPKATDFKLQYTSYTYNGYSKTPAVTVRDVNGNTIDNDNYTVSYSNNKNIGTATVTVTGKNDYSFTKKLTFTIKAKDLASTSKVYVSLCGYDDVKVSWNSVSGAGGYYVYYKKSTSKSYTYAGKTTSTSYKLYNFTDGAKYTFRVYPCVKDGNGYHKDGSYRTSSEIYMLKKVTSVKAVRSGTKVKVSWSNISGESGYQISRSTKKTGTNIVKTYSTTSGKYYSVSATKGKTYYYKVRAYKTVSGKKIYGPWSTVYKFRR